MITIIHGEDTTKSRLYLSSLKEKDTGLIVSLEGATLTLSLLQEHLGSTSLFAEQKTLYIENLITKQKKKKEGDDIVSFLSQDNLSYPFVLWEEKELTKPQLIKFPKASIKLFALPKLLFSFLDAFSPGNSAKLTTLFHTLTEHEEVQLIFFMLLRQVRILLAIHANNTTIDEMKRVAIWQKQKLEKQAHSFSVQQLMLLHKKLFVLDYQQKTGKLVLPLADHIDILLCEL